MKKLIVTLIILTLLGGGYYYFNNVNVQGETTQSSEHTNQQLKPEHIYTPEELLVEVNAERAKVGVAPLQLDERLNQSAQKKADDMRIHNYYEHISPIDGKHGYSYINEYMGGVCQYSSENLNKSLITDDPVPTSSNGWMSSQAHRDAILDPKYDYIGFGSSRAKDITQLYVAHFCDLP